MRKTLEARYDTAADVLYLVSAEGEIARSAEVAPGISMEYGDSGEVIGVEILRASKVFGETIVASLHARQAGILG